MNTLRRMGLALALAAAGITGLAPSAEAQCDQVFSQRGTVPILITAPHGGAVGTAIPRVTARDCSQCNECASRSLTTLDGRSCGSCNTCNSGSGDRHTGEITDRLNDELTALLGGRPYVVKAEFNRRFLDANRPNGWSAYDDPDAEACWEEYHGKIREFIDEIHVRFRNGGVLYDIHGQGLPGFTASICRGTRDGRTVRDMIDRYGDDALIGPGSTLAALADLGWPVFPPGTPPGTPVEQGDDGCFNGGFTVANYGSHTADGIDSIQIEIGSDIRDGRRIEFAEDLAVAMATNYHSYLVRGHIQNDVGAADESGDGYGRSLAVGDFDGDGRHDLAVGVPREDVGSADSGMVVIHYDPATGGRGSFHRLTQKHVDAAEEAGDRFGETLAAGDFNRDGFDDLAVGVPFEDIGSARDTGMVTVFFGSKSGLLVRRSGSFRASAFERIVQRHAGAADETGDRFGSALAVGDFNRDSIDDLAVGVPFEDFGGARDNGLVIVYFGSTSGLLRSTSNGVRAVAFERPAQNHAGAANETGDRFGHALAAGDFDGDGTDDLAVGVPFEDDEARDDGMVVTLFGSSQGLLRSVNGRQRAVRFERLAQKHVNAQHETSDRFGYTLAAGDFDGNGIDDLAVGVPFEDDRATDDGMVVAFYGSSQGLLVSASGGLRATQFERISQTHANAASEARDRFGMALATGDVNADGHDDLIVGVPLEDFSGATDNGMIIAYRGSSRGLLPARFTRRGQRAVGGIEQSGDQFGSAIAVGDFDGDGRDDVCVGAPREDVLLSNDAGAVYFYRGVAGGISELPWE